MAFRRVRVVSEEGGLAFNSHIYDIETGQELEHVTKVEIIIDPKEMFNRAIIHTYRVEYDLVAEAEIHEEIIHTAPNYTNLERDLSRGEDECEA